MCCSSSFLSLSGVSLSLCLRNATQQNAVGIRHTIEPKKRTGITMVHQIIDCAQQMWNDTAYKIQTICIVHIATISFIHAIWMGVCVCMLFYLLIHFACFFFVRFFIWSVFLALEHKFISFLQWFSDWTRQMLSHPTPKTMTNVLLQTSVAFVHWFCRL